MPVQDHLIMDLILKFVLKPLSKRERNSIFGSFFCNDYPYFKYVACHVESFARFGTISIVLERVVNELSFVGYELSHFVCNL